jgi:serine/threonine protein kinase
MKVIRKTIRGKEHGINNSYYDHIIYKEDSKFIYEYIELPLYMKIKKLYNRISDIKNVQKMEFIDDKKRIISPEYNSPLETESFNSIEKNEIKKQLITFLKELNNRGISHRDLHIKNAFFHNRETLIIIDWEFIEVDDSFYDISGKGYSPLKTGNMNIFHKSPFSFNRFFNECISIDDFIN